MNITSESELMENQKHAVVMGPEQAFEVLQSQDGDALFFSIGTDNVFYLTREVTETSTGWDKIDLSSALSSQHGGAPVAAKMFGVAQNVQTLGIDLALVLTVGGIDFLYLSLGNANTDDSWSNGVTWTVAPFNVGTAPNPLTIADVFVMNIPAAGSTAAAENIFVDILRTPGDPLKLLDRYYIVPGGSPQWNPRPYPADVAAGSISSCLGQRTNDEVPGIYTFGTINGEQELFFTPQSGWDPNAPPDPANLNVPTGASAIASALDASGVSNLFVAGTDGLYLFTPDNQGNQATPVQIVSNDLVAGASALAASTNGNQTAVWGMDPQGALFYVMCPAGQEADSTAWSNPVPLLTSVEGFAFFLNLNAGNNVIFANVDGQDLVQLTQDPVTTDWLQRSILLPSTSTSDVAVYTSFTTHIQITDDNGVGAPNAAVAVTATSPVSVYINDVYYLLSPTVAVNTTADPTGVLTVVQETQSLSGACFKVVLTDSPEVVANINPMHKALATLGTIQSGSDLAKVHIPSADGTQKQLVPSSVSSDHVDAAAKSIAHFVQINAGLPQDGSRQSPSGASSAAALSTATIEPRIWGITFASGGLEYHEGEDAVQHFGLRKGAARDSAALESIGTDIAVAAGDFFRWVKHIYKDVDGFIVREEKGLYHFFATIAGEVYDVLLDCTDAITHAVEFVFHKIEVFFEDLIKWLGFVFNWNDILRTHLVLKNIFTKYMAQCINNLSNVGTQLQQSFTDVQNFINSWAGIPDNIPPSLSGSSLDSSTKSSQPAPGQNSPQSNWGLHHLKSNAASGSTTAQPNQGVLGDIESVLQPLITALEQEQEILEAAGGKFKSEIIDQIHQLSFEDLLKAVMAIIADTLLGSLENLLQAAIDVLVTLTEGVVEGLNATIDIPVISWLYNKFAHADLSLLDLTCLVAAIPVTIGYKLIAEAAPFPDDATTTALINAPDFASIQQIYNPAQTLAAEASGAAALAASIPAPDNKILVLTGGIASVVGTVSLCIFSPWKQSLSSIPEPSTADMTKLKVFTVVNGVSYLLYVAPDIMGQIPDLQDAKWWAITNQVIADLMIAKSMGDMGVGLTAKGSKAQNIWNPVSPWLDLGGNTLWQVPTSAAICDSENWNTAGLLSFLGGSCFDLNGIMSPALANDKDTTSWAILVGVATALNLAYGAMSCASSVLTFKS